MKYIIEYRKSFDVCPFTIKGAIFSVNNLAMLAVDLGDAIGRVNIPIEIRQLAKEGRIVQYEDDDGKITPKYVSYKMLLSDEENAVGLYDIAMSEDMVSSNGTKTTRTKVLFGFTVTDILDLVNEIVELLPTVDVSMHQLDAWLEFMEKVDNYNFIEDMNNMEKEKKNKQTLGDLFQLNNETKTIVCKQKHNGKTVVGIAQCSKDDTFNLELGKAVAFAKCELIMRDKDLESLEMYIQTLETWKAFGNFEMCKRIAERNINELYKKLHIYERYYTNQKKIVNLLKRHPQKFYNYTDFRKILKDALYEVLYGAEKI